MGGALALPLEGTLVNAWEADTGIGVADAADVTTWTDRIASSVLTAIAGKKPTYRATAATSGLPSVEFGPASGGAAASTYMTGDTQVNTTAANSVTVVAVLELQSTAQQVILDGDPTYRQALWITGANFALYAGSTVSSLAHGSSGALMMLAGVMDSQGAGSYVRRDGTDGSTGDAHPGNDGRLDNLRVGADVGEVNGMDAYLHAIYIIGDTATSEQLDELQTYCVSKWGTPA